MLIIKGLQPSLRQAALTIPYGDGADRDIFSSQIAPSAVLWILTSGEVEVGVHEEAFIDFSTKK
jgi:hypothetical protein